MVSMAIGVDKWRMVAVVGGNFEVEGTVGEYFDGIGCL